MREPARRQAEDADVRKRNRRQRDERVAEEIAGRHALAREQRRGGRRRQHRLDGVAESAHADRDRRNRDRAERQEQNRLEGVHPRGAAHPAEEHVAHDDERDDGAAEPVRHAAAADRGERRAASHDRNDDVRHEQHRLHREDHRADVSAFPAVAKHLHRRHETIALAERPEARADHEDAERNDQRRRGCHQPIGDDAVREGVTRCAQDGERRHVRAEQRQQEHNRAERASGQEVVLRVRLLRGRAAREDPDVQDDRQIRKDDGGRNHRRELSSRCAGQCHRTSTQRSAEAAIVYAA